MIPWVKLPASSSSNRMKRAIESLLLFPKLKHKSLHLTNYLYSSSKILTCKASYWYSSRRPIIPDDCGRPDGRTLGSSCLAISAYLTGERQEPHHHVEGARRWCGTPLQDPTRLFLDCPASEPFRRAIFRLNFP